MATDPTLPLHGEATDRHEISAILRPRWERRAALVEGEIRAARLPERQAALWTELGRIAEQRLDRPEEARDAYERALALGDAAEAGWGLVRLAASERDWVACEAGLTRLESMALDDMTRWEVRRLREQVARRQGIRPAEQAAFERPGTRSVLDDDEENTGVGEPLSPVAVEPLPDEPAAASARARASARGTTDRRLAAAVLLRAASDLRIRRELAAAEELVEDAARLEPGDDAVLDARARLARDRGDREGLARALLDRAGASDSPSSISARAVASLVLRISLGRVQDAAAALAGVPELPGDPWSLTRAATELGVGRGLDAAERLGAAARGARSDRIAALLELAAAEAAREVGRPDQVLARLEAAEVVLPRSGLVRRRMLECLEQRQDWATAVSLLDSSGDDPEANAWARTRAARICLTKLGDGASAEALLRASLREWPAGIAPRLMLEGLLAEAGRAQELDELLTTPSTGGSTTTRWRRLWLRRSGRLEAPGEAVALASSLAEAEGSARTIWIVQALLAEQGRWTALYESLTRELAAGSPRRVSCLLRLAQTRARLDAAEDVARAVSELLAPDDGDRLLGRVHERLCFSSGHLAGLIDLWTTRLEQRPDPSTRLRLALLCLVGLPPPSLDDSGAPREPDPERVAAARVALTCLEQMRAESPLWNQLRPLASLAAVEVGDWRRVLALVSDEIDAAPPAACFWAILAAAEIADHRLSEPAAAIIEYERAATLRPGHPAVLRGLLRLYRRTMAWTTLESMLLAQARRPEDTPALPWLARLALTDLELRRDDERALSTCIAILRDHPAFAPALRGVERLLSARGDYGPLAEAWSRAAEELPEEARGVALRAVADAALLAAHDEGGQPAGNLPAGGLQAVFRAIVRHDPADRAAALGWLSEAPPGPEHAADRAQALEGLTAHVASDLDRMLLFTQAAEELVASGDALRAIPRAESALQFATGARIGVLLAIADAIAARATTEPAAAVQLAVTMAALADECRVPANRRDALSVAARLYQADPTRRTDALRAVQGVLAVDPKNPDALTRLVALRSELGQWRELCDELGAVIALDPEAPDTIVLLEQIALVQREHLRALDEAAHTCDAILARNPRHSTAMLWRAESHLAERAWAEAARGFEGVLAVVSGPERIPPLRALAALYHDRVQDALRARTVLEELTAAEPHVLEHLRDLSDVAFGERHWSIAEDVGRRLIARETDPQRRIDALLRMAQIREHGFRDTRGAVEWYQRAVDVDPIRQASIDELCACLKRAGELWGLESARRQYSGALRERLFTEPTRIAWFRRFGESLAQRGLDLSCELVSSMIDWLESRGASGRAGRYRLLDLESIRGVLKAVGVPGWATVLLPQLDPILRSEFEWQPKKLGVKRSDRVTALTGHPVRDRVRPVADLLGMREVEIYAFPVEGRLVRTPLAERWTLVADPGIAQTSEAVVRFTVAQAMLRLVSGLRVAEAFSPAALRDALLAVTMALDPAAAPLDDVAIPDPALIRRLGRDIPRAGRGELANLLREAFSQPFDAVVLVQGIERGLAAAAVAACGSLAAGVESLAQGAPPRNFDRSALAAQLVRDVLSEEVIAVIDRAPLA